LATAAELGQLRQGSVRASLALMLRGVCAGLAATAILAAGATVQAQPLRTQSPVLTRLVQSYTEYEKRLAGALSRGDAGEIDKLVSPDFEMRSAAHPGAPTPRAQWIAQSVKETASRAAIEQMAVHDYGSVRIVSFLSKSATDGDAPGVMFVDVWTQSGQGSILKLRYAGMEGSGNFPGDAAPPPFNKRF
jgi:hypothetical protein